MYADIDECKEVRLHISTGDLTYVENFIGMKKEIPENKVTLLYMSASYNQIDIAEYLLSIGEDINWNDNENKNTPLMIALSKRKIEMAEFLLNNGADLYKENRFGKNVLDIAMELNIIGFLEKNMVEIW